MKDWKTYAIVALAAWCAWLTLHEPKKTIVTQTIKTECVDELMREAFKWSNNSFSRSLNSEKDRSAWDNEEYLRSVISCAKEGRQRLCEFAKRMREDAGSVKNGNAPNSRKSE